MIENPKFLARHVMSVDETGKNDLSAMIGLIITLEIKTVEKKEAMVITSELSDRAGLFSSDQSRARQREREGFLLSQPMWG